MHVQTLMHMHPHIHTHKKYQTKFLIILHFFSPIQSSRTVRASYLVSVVDDGDDLRHGPFLQAGLPSLPSTL